MTVTNQTVRVYRGDTHSLTITMDVMADGSIFDPTLDVGYYWWMAETKYDDPLVERSTGAPGLEVLPTGIAITLCSADTDFRPGCYYHELKVFDGDDVSTAMTGFFIIRGALQIKPTTVAPASGDVGLSPGAPTVGR